MAKKNGFAWLIEYFLLRLPRDPSHAVMVQKYFMHMWVKQTEQICKCVLS